MINSYFNLKITFSTGEDILEIDSRFNANRSDLPPMFIATPFDKSGMTWTKEEPSLVILSRITKLANAALRTIETSLLTSNHYDVIQVSILLG